MEPAHQSSDSVALAETLRGLRRARRLTQKQLADASGISLRAIQDLETGRTSSPQFYTLTRLAEVLSQTEAERQSLFDAAYPRTSEQAAAAASPAAVRVEAGTPDVGRGDHPPEMPQISEPSRGQRIPRSRRNRAVALLVPVALATVSTVVWRETQDSRLPQPTTTPSSACNVPAPNTPASASAGPAGWDATVVNTWSSARCKDLGTRPRVSPLRSDVVWPGFFTGTHVVVTCYFTEGARAADRDTGVVSKVWYRLADDKPLWDFRIVPSLRPRVCDCSSEGFAAL